MILMLSLWHTLIIVAVFLSLSAFICMVGILEVLSLSYKGAQSDIQDEQQAYEAKREKRSAAAKQGHATRRAKRHHPQGDSWADATLDGLEMGAKVTAPTVTNALDEAETERVLRQIDAQAKARGE